MNGTSRTVRRFRLRAPSESAIHRAVVLFEDALRTASLPDAAGRIVIVRKLALGRIDSRVAPQMIALQLERAFERLSPECAYADTPGASGAPAVWFRDALDAHTRLALRIAEGDPADGWYWKLAVKAWRPGTPLAQALRGIMLSLATLPEARTALPQWTAALAGAGHTERLVSALHAADVPHLAQAAALRIGNTSGAHRASTDVSRRSHDEPDPRLRHSARASIPAAGRRARSVGGPAVVDPRRELLNALLVAAGASVESDRRAARSTGYAPGVRVPSRKAQATASGEDTPQPAATGTPSGNDQPHAFPGASRIRGASALKEAAVGRETLDTSTPTHRADPVHDPRDGSAVLPAAPWVSPDCVTRAGGLLFLIPVLQRLGYPEWLEAHPGWVRCDIAKRVLAAVLTRLQIAPEDPAWHLVRHPSGPRSAPRRFVAPARWYDRLVRSDGRARAAEIGTVQTLWDASGRLLLGTWSGRCPPALASAWQCAESCSADGRERDRTALVTAAWVVAARRWLRRGARIGFADLVLRPAIQSLTPTHADLEFEMSACALSIRRSGLDFDPGWVPWFGRVVTFHYR